MPFIRLNIMTCTSVQCVDGSAIFYTIFCDCFDSMGSLFCLCLHSSDALLSPSDRRVYTALIRLITPCNILMSFVTFVRVCAPVRVQFGCTSVSVIIWCRFYFEACICMSQKRIKLHWCWGEITDFLLLLADHYNPLLYKDTSLCRTYIRKHWLGF